MSPNPSPAADDWFRVRGYAHLDWPLSRAEAEKLVTHPERVARHAFLPFIRFTMEEPRYRRATHEVKAKRRDVAFASHRDSQIFSYYACLLSTAYEKLLAELGISDCVLAYRRFSPKKGNVHFAAEVFSEIRRLAPCHVAAFDIEKFFDGVDHKALKAAWCRVLGSGGQLPTDHYAVFKAITRHSWVQQEALYKALEIGRRRQQRPWPTGKPRLCTSKQFRVSVRGGGYVECNPHPYGIPQGSPISAVLSNILLLDLDTRIFRECRGVGALYRRYCDDILLAGSETAVIQLEQQLREELSAVRLSLNEDKTDRCQFSIAADGTLHTQRALQYLGLTFDGQRVLIRSRTLARHIRKRKAAVRAARQAAVQASRKGGSRKVRKQSLYERYSHLGKKRSFLSYVQKAAETAEAPEMRRQVRGFWAALNEEVEEADRE